MLSATYMIHQLTENMRMLLITLALSQEQGEEQEEEELLGV